MPARPPFRRIDTWARGALLLAAILGALSIALIGWVAIFYIDFSTPTRGGIFNSHIVVLGLILGPAILPMLSWKALRDERFHRSIGLSCLSLLTLVARSFHWFWATSRGI
jgi:hypothetical protein